MLSVRNLISRTQKGFTLIELLIVIAILGVLAAAVLSAINPVEQINRGRDTGSLSDAEQLLSAISRYNASQGLLPWQSNSGSPTGVTWAPVDASWQNDGTPTKKSVLTLLNETGELLPAYINRITAPSYNTLNVYNHGDPGDSTYVCFKTLSGSQKKLAENRCNSTGGLPSDLTTIKSTICPTTGSVYYCLP